ncbi:hypothetical protein GIB67_012132 [Kingdonia uniflora]|uniref:RING-type domain-containing protein n=1 Tax=Kingdonia uniflora TaxID=39325 RepID=A0A7J7N9K2_9MAGN|nr:hypothetical protein GIB67_012132 [Kingdonia uniflora]
MDSKEEEKNTLKAATEEEEEEDASLNNNNNSVSCSICLDLVIDKGGDRSIAKLQCGHQFHLDCIGSEFNAKGAMQCPNCRKVEEGQWFYANRPGHSGSLIDVNFEELIEELYELSYPELPFGLPWCPLIGPSQRSQPLFEEREVRPNSYHDMLRNEAFMDHLNASSRTHVCPYLHGYPHVGHTLPSSAGNDVHNIGSFLRHPFGMGGPPLGEFPNIQEFSAVGSRLDRNDSSGLQSFGSLLHPTPFLQGSVTRMAPAVVGDARVHSHGRGGRAYSHTHTPSSFNVHAPRSGRRTRPRTSAHYSSSSAEIGGFHGFSVMPEPASGNHQDGGRRHNQFYSRHMSWIPVEGESWGSFHPNLNPHARSRTDTMSNRNLYGGIVWERMGSYQRRAPHPGTPQSFI